MIAEDFSQYPWHPLINTFARDFHRLFAGIFGFTRLRKNGEILRPLKVPFWPGITKILRNIRRRTAALRSLSQQVDL